MKEQSIAMMRKVGFRFVIECVLIAFIVLNIFDFFGALSWDWILIKKILSWSVVMYFFYRISVTRLLIGKRFKLLDCIYVVTCSLFVIPRLLYVFTLNVYQHIKGFEFDFFLIELMMRWFYTLFNNVFGVDVFILTLTLGMLSLGVVGIFLVCQNVERSSFMGTLPRFMKNSNILIRWFILVFYMFFIGIVVFEVFMEWFALAVDALLVVVGVIYYMLIFIARKSTDVQGVLLSIFNVGNSMYKVIVETFGRFGWLHWACALLLALHAVVDFGVFGLWYITGVEHSLYSAGFDGRVNVNADRTPLFGFNVDSHFGNSISVSGCDIFCGTSLFLWYGSFWVVWGLLSCLPFWLLYKKRVLETISVSNSFWKIVFFLFTFVGSMSLMARPLWLFFAQDGLKGVEVLTSNVGLWGASSFQWMWVLLLTCLMFVWYGWKDYDMLFKKITLFVIGFFLIWYASFFIVSVVVYETWLLNFVKENSVWKAMIAFVRYVCILLFYGVGFFSFGYIWTKKMLLASEEN